MAAISNYLQCKVSGEASIRFLNLCRKQGFTLKHVELQEDGFRMEIGLEDFKKLRPLIRKTRVRVHILNRRGPAFFLYRHKFRLWFLFGLAFAAAFIWYLSLFVWQIDIEGNRMYTDDLILQSLRTLDVQTGCKKSELSLPAIEEELRIMYNQMTWVSASITGTKLKIEIKEGNLQSEGNDGKAEEGDNDSDSDSTAGQGVDLPSNMTSDFDATITSMVVRRGTASVKTGDTVAAGDVLVEGKVYIYNDDATLKKVDYIQADADIMADYEVYYQKDYKRQYAVREYDSESHKAYVLDFGGKEVPLPAFYQPSGECEIWSWQRQFRLTPTFYLPFVIHVTEYKPYVMTSAEYTDEALERQASEDLENYLQELMKKGVQIIGNSVKISLDANGCHASGIISLNGPIGTDTPIDSSSMAFDLP